MAEFFLGGWRGGTALSALTKLAANLADSGGRPRGAVYHSKWGLIFLRRWLRRWQALIFLAKMREIIENDVIGASPSLHSKWGQGWGGTHDVIFDCYPLLSPPLPSPLSTLSPRTTQDSWVQSISDFWFPISGFGFRVSDFKRISDFSFQTTDLR